MNWFGRKKLPVSASCRSTGLNTIMSDPVSTIVKLRENLSMQEKREEHLLRKIDIMTLEAKEKMTKNDKKGAIFSLKRKKLYESEMDKILNVKMTLETQIMNLESASQNAETFQAMNAGKNAMQKIRTDIGIEKVDDIMDDIREEMELANEINNAIAQPVDPLLADEDELLVELQDIVLKDKVNNSVKTKYHSDIGLPYVPNSQFPVLQKEEEEELKKLEAELSG